VIKNIMENTVQIHINQLRPGDTIIHNGKEMTVSKNNIKECSFMGRSVFGDCYHSGHKPVIRKLMPKWNKNICVMV